MQFTTIIAALFASAAIAAPLIDLPYGSEYDSGETSTESSGNQCSETQEASCCNSEDGTPALGLQCAVAALGGTCSGSVQCCDVGGDGGLIALNLCVPISL